MKTFLLLPFVVIGLLSAASSYGQEGQSDAGTINPMLVGKAETNLRAILDEMARQQVHGVLPTGVMHAPPNVHVVGGQKTRPDGSMDVDMKLGLQPKTAGSFLLAYETFGDRKYLDTALKTCDFLLRAQQPKGFWLRSYILTSDGEVKPSSPEASEPADKQERVYPDGTAKTLDPTTCCRIQDQYQSENILLLVYAWRLTGEQKYLDAAKRGADCLLALENENGSWPDYWDFAIPREEGPPSSWFGVRVGGSHNDGSTRDPMRVMVLMYFVTKDAKYLARLGGIGPWILKTQIGEGKVRGWCLQYGLDDKPIMARSWEMPVIEPRTLHAFTLSPLILFYLTTKDERYINVIRETYDWMKSVEKPDGWAFQYLPDGSEVFSRNYKIYRYDKPETWPPEGRSVLYSRKAVNLNQVQQILDINGQGGYEALRNHFRRPVKYSDEQYREAREAAALNAAAVKSVKGEKDVRPLLEYLFNVRLAEGAISPETAASGGFGVLSLYPGWEWHNRVWKVEDWFNLPLGK